MRLLIPSICLLLGTMPTLAQQRPNREPREPHAFLARMAGVWEAQAKFWTWTQPTAPPMEAKATINAEMIMGGRFLFQKVEGDFMGVPLEAIGVLGYDNRTGQFEAVSFDNTSTGMSLHAGRMDEDGHITLRLQYINQTTGETVERRTKRELISAHEWLETAYETRNGVERQVMEIRARRMEQGTSSR
jgi:Protein of unknown function (DUF1579)